MITNRIDKYKFFSFLGEYPTWIISDNVLNALKEFKFKYIKGYYLEKNLVINFENNLSIIDKYKGDLSPEIFFNHCYISIQLLVRYFRYDDLDTNFISKYNIKEYHLNMINRLYFNEYLEGSTPKGIYLDDKRPLGNSNIIDDIVSEVNPELVEEEYELTEKEENEYFDKFYQALDILIKLFSEQRIKFTNFVYSNFEDKKKLTKEQLNYYRDNWTPCKSEFREIKLNEILNQKKFYMIYYILLNLRLK